MPAAKLTLVVVVSTWLPSISVARADDLRPQYQLATLPTAGNELVEPRSFLPLPRPPAPLTNAESTSLHETTTPQAVDFQGEQKPLLPRRTQSLRLPQAPDETSADAPAPLPPSAVAAVLSAIDVNLSSLKPTSEPEQAVYAALSVSIKTVGRPHFHARRRVLSVITVTNSGSADIEQLRLSVSLPARTELLLASPRPATNQDRLLQFDLGTLASQAGRHLQLVLKTHERGAIGLQAMACSSAKPKVFPLKSKLLRQAQVDARGSQPQLSIRCESVDEAGTVRPSSS